MVLAHGAQVESLAVLADGRLASGGQDGKIKLWRKDGTSEPVVLSHGTEVQSLVVLPDGQLASGGGGKIKLWPKDGTSEPVVWSLGSFVITVNSLAVSSDGRLASGSLDGKINLWPKEGVGEPEILLHGSPVHALAVLADGRLASGGGDGNVKIWPKAGVDEPAVLPHGDWIMSLAVLADGRLASGDQHGKIKLWPKIGWRRAGGPFPRQYDLFPCGAARRKAGQWRQRREDQAVARRRTKTRRCPLSSRRPQPHKGRVGPLHRRRHSPAAELSRPSFKLADPGSIAAPRRRTPL